MSASDSSVSLRNPFGDWPEINTVVNMRGRLIRVVGSSEAVYVVAQGDGVKALALIREKVAGPSDYVEDLGRVTDELIVALELEPDQFKKV